MLFNNKRYFGITALLMAVVMLGVVVFSSVGYGESIATQTSAEPIDYTKPLYSFMTEDEDAFIPDDATRIDMSGSSVKISGAGADADASTILIQLPGTYVLTGESTGRQVLISAKKTDTVRLVLDNAIINNEGGAAIYAQKAGKVVIILPDGTSNAISGGLAEDIDSDDDDVKSAQAAVYIKNSLAITGGGTLTIESPGRGIWAKDNLIMTGGTLNVATDGNALRGSDGVAMKGVTATIKTGGDGIKSTKADDPSKGFIQLEDCTLDITAHNDSIQAESALMIFSGEYTIHTGSGADAVVLSSHRSDQGRGGFIQPIQPAIVDAAAAESEESMKGLKAGTIVSVLGGTFTLDTQDDAVHSDGGIWIGGGTFDIRTGDDAVHAEGLLAIDGGSIVITRCNEGLEGSAIEINGGDHTITAVDDAINLADGTANTGGRGWGMQGRSGSTIAMATLYINGGIIHATGGADTIDVNGNIVMNGGELYLSGQSQGMEGAIDFDGSFTVFGGRMITAGSVLSVAAGSTQSALLVSYAQAVTEGSLIELRAGSNNSDNSEDSDNVILSLNTEVACSVSGFTAPELTAGESVSIWVNGEKRFDVTLSAEASVTTAAEGGGAYSLQNGRGFGSPGGFGGFGEFNPQSGVPDPQGGGQRNGGFNRPVRPMETPAPESNP
ncbi:hypothetical protein FACS1894184_17700 [Clostridia bacterium]|nr:hypothetical protein FACS1894184_17700 [Clostridia bacterium]